jgi:hypothetical protein
MLYDSEVQQLEREGWEIVGGNEHYVRMRRGNIMHIHYKEDELEVLQRRHNALSKKDKLNWTDNGGSI